MRNSSFANQQARALARDRGFSPRDFFWITVKDRASGEPVSFGIWSGDDPIEVAIVSGVTGGIVTRTYVGGANLSIGEIARVSDMTIQTLEVEMSAIAPVCQQIVRGYDARLAKGEVHVGYLDPDTRVLVDPPEIDFLGEVDGAPIETGSAGGESLITLRLVSVAISMLTRTNPRKRSYEAQKRRLANDEFGLHGNSVASWNIPWGQDAS